MVAWYRWNSVETHGHMLHAALWLLKNLAHQKKTLHLDAISCQLGEIRISAQPCRKLICM